MTESKIDTTDKPRQATKRIRTTEQKDAQKAWQRKQYQIKYRLDPDYTAKRRRYTTSENGKAVRKAAEKRRRLAKRAEVIEALGGICNRCGFSDPRALQFDHINGGGWSYEKKGTHGRNGNSIYPKILANLEHFQLLCANCNWIKREENKEYGPGYRERVESVRFKG